MKLFDYFRPFQNAGWPFARFEGLGHLWSGRNRIEFVQPLNYPTNMLYAATLAAAGRLYNLPHFIEQAEALRKVDAPAVL